MKTKIKSYGDEVTDFHSKEIPNVASNHACLAVISFDSALNKNGNSYPQVLSKNANTLQKKKKVIRHIIGNFESPSGDSDYSDE